MTTTVTLPPLTADELDAILAGLRALHYLMEHDQLPTAIRAVLIDHGHSLGLDQIDDLCHRLNCA